MTNKYNWNYNFLQMFNKNIIVRTNIKWNVEKIDSPWHWILVERAKNPFSIMQSREEQQLNLRNQWWYMHQYCSKYTWQWFYFYIKQSCWQHFPSSTPNLNFIHHHFQGLLVPMSKQLFWFYVLLIDIVSCY